jgi:hypothetical protein
LRSSLRELFGESSSGDAQKGASASIPAAVQAWRMAAPVATLQTATAEKSGDLQAGNAKNCCFSQRQTHQ